MIKDFVKNGIACLKCTECGSWTTIFKRTVHSNFHIDNDASKSNMDSFIAQHSLCKKTSIQTDIFKSNP